MSELVYWIWLSLALSPASRSFKNLIAFYGDPRALYEAQDIVAVEGLGAKEKEALAQKDMTQAEEIQEYCFHNNISILTYQDERYPKLLRDISDPPVLLYVKGQVPSWNTCPCIGVIGTRAMTYYGGETAFDIAYDLARMGCITVSGMALGIDGVCAAATIEAKGVTVAVLGSGIDVIYPSEHEYLYECIVHNNGAVISELPPKSRPEKYHFPIRNRIISGLSRASIVVEGEAGSGSLITARRAVAQGRTVFAVPGRIGAPNSEGPLLLLKHKKAKAITCADDVYDHYRDEYLPYMNAFRLLEPREATFELIMEKYRVVCAKPREKSFDGTDKSSKIKGLETHRKNSPTYQKRTADDSVIGKIKSFFFNTPIADGNQETQEIEKMILEKEAALMQQMDSKERKIFKQMPYGKEVHPDAILLDEAEGDESEEVLSVLTFMEMKGYVEMTPGGGFMKKID